MKGDKFDKDNLLEQHKLDTEGREKHKKLLEESNDINARIIRLIEKENGNK